jgi:regulator of RNase E activity RraA
MRTGTVNVSILHGGVMDYPGDLICEDGDGMTQSGHGACDAKCLRNVKTVRYPT